MTIFLYVLFVGGLLEFEKTHQVEMPNMKSCLKVMQKARKREDLIMYCGTQNHTWCEPKLVFEYEEVEI